MPLSRKIKQCVKFNIDGKVLVVCLLCYFSSLLFESEWSENKFNAKKRKKQKQIHDRSDSIIAKLRDFKYLL